eukprot:m.215324 g.215324  ORF g.215324 m.215324 type:complete len:132 (-) comp13799_c3_seq3:1038-1433(-)
MKFGVVVAVAVVVVVAVALCGDGIEGQRRVTQSACFQVRAQCSDTNAVYSNCVPTGHCLEGFQMDVERVGNECHYTMVTYRQGCPTDETPDVVPSVNNTVAYTIENIQNLHCKAFPGLGYVTITRECEMNA